MKQLFWDTETYYSSKEKYSLRNLTYAQYINDPRFQLIGLSYAFDDAPAQWVEGPHCRDLLHSFDWKNVIAVQHNANWDLSVLHYRYNLHPAHAIDTMAMATSLGLRSVLGGSLAALADSLRNAGYPIGHKGDEVLRADGLRYEDFSPAQLAAYGAYCVQDTDICRDIANILIPMMTVEELQYQSMIIRCGTEPTLQLDKALLEFELERVKTLKATTLDAAAIAHNCTPTQFRTILMSNAKFGDLLVKYNAEVPMKISKATGKAAPALAKSDAGFQELLEHEDPVIQIFANARAGNKTTVTETRLERLIDMHQYGPLAVHYNIHAAHTGRLGAQQKINLMSLESGRGVNQTNNARRSLLAPDGYVLGVTDSSQIECRVSAYIANDQTMLDIFREKRDPYSELASDMYRRPAAEIRAQAKAGEPLAVRQRAGGKAGILSGIFGTGVGGFYNYARTVAKMDIDMEEAELTISTFRTKFFRTKEVWRTCNEVLHAMMAGRHGWFGGPDGRLFYFDGAREEFGIRMPSIRLPDGNHIVYLNLREEEAPPALEGQYQRKTNILYDTAKGRNKVPTPIHGAKMHENLTQSLAFAILKLQGLKINERFRVIFNCHDEWAYSIPEGQETEATQFADECFRWVPDWVPGLPLSSESATAKRYGDA